ncbi:hypothetical protein GBA52_024320 [Prunus armeniaca]|nr:hypothetical protein GBA52_024320 [Prunus armeniaca]
MTGPSFLSHKQSVNTDAKDAGHPIGENSAIRGGGGGLKRRGSDNAVVVWEVDSLTRKGVEEEGGGVARLYEQQTKP